MSLETNIAELTEAVKLLTEELKSLKAGSVIVTEDREVATDLPKNKKPQKLEVVETPVVEEVVETPVVEEVVETPVVEEITVRSLQDQCLKITRADSSKKAIIKKLINSYGGADVIPQVPAQFWPELKLKLEELV